jgi:ankyrin repeat protein
MDLKPNSYKYLLKNKRFQTEADLDKKTMAALRTFDLEFLKNYIEEFKPNLNVALFLAASIGFTEAVKLLLSDSRVDLPSAWDNEALRNAAWRGHTEVVKLLLSDSRVDLSAWNNGDLRFAARNGHTEIVKLLLSDSRVDPSAESIEFFLRSTAREDVRKLLKSYLKKKQSKE